jgi:hypothetical protein
MKISAITALCAVALLAGCESMSSRMEERFSPVPPHIRTYAASEKAVYEAGRKAVKGVGLLLGHTSLAQGLIEGYAPIQTGTATSDTRQTTIEIRLVESGSEETQVALLVWNQTEGTYPAGSSKQAFREHSLYEAYFAALQEALVANGSLKPDGKP